MIKKLLTLFCATMLTGGVFAQITPEYTSQNGTSNNVYPWGNASYNKVQWIYYPADFTPTISAGLITKVYIMMNPSTGSGGTKTYGNFKIGLANTTATAIGTGLPWFPVTYVYDAPSVTFNQVMGQWIEIPLQTPFFYDGTSNIIFEGSQTSYTNSGISIVHNSSNGNRRMWGSTTGTASTGSGTGCLYWGFDMVKENDLTPTKLVSPNIDDLCSGYNELKVRVKNMGIIDVTPFTVNWSVDNVLQTPVVVNNTLQSYGNIDSLDIDFGNINIPLNTPMNLKVWTSNPNNTVDPNPANDTLNIQLLATRQGITLSPIADTVMCKGDQITIDAGYNANTDYTWSNGNQTQQAIFSTLGQHWIFAYNTDGCMHRDTFLINEAPAPTAAPIIAAIDQGYGQYIFDIANARNIDFYEWNFGDGSPLEYGPGPKPHTYSRFDSFNVTLRMANVCDTITRNLYVVYQQDLNTKNLVFDQNVDLYPIPFNQTLHITAKGQTKISAVYLYNALGQLVYEKNSDAHKLSIELEDFTTGQYLIKVKIGDQYFTKSIIKN